MRLDDLEAQINDYLHGMDPQLPEEVTRALKVDQADAHLALRNLTATGDVLMTTTPEGLELFEAAHGGYLPKGWTA